MKSPKTIAARLGFSILGTLALSTPAQAIKVVPDFDTEPGLATVFWGAFTTTGPFIGTTVTFNELSDSDQKRLLLARDDAAAFVATNTAVCGALLESALLMLRQKGDLDHYDDLVLACAILASTH
ncbi:DUF2388 domain-containing protein [Pseudomonas chlororaphis]|uniref:DUF2388 domain-containing protein n=1 Tax=Pseudomonas chlororaphis TaxID=587753 RepID=UPI00209A6483|nr:DUF2388 domain-containing protein [Pseudomonas chlororaphis]MCO7572544.1 DUF2388 domain-containing protein [Pseudomonas chlororaphis]MCO7590379.1 DUF2388 domain-containing protein [Pseudomonas chlororaphis]